MTTTATKAAWTGLLATLLLIAAAVIVPLATGWQVHARADRSDGVAPLHAFWDLKVGPGTLPAILLVLAGIRWAPTLAETLRWRRLLPVAYLASLCWLLSLALVDGTSGLSRVLGNPDEYLRTARQVTDVHHLLQTFVARIPAAAPHNWPTHVAGHPPGILLFFVLLVRIGLGGDRAAGVVVTVLAATLAVLRAPGRGAPRGSRQASPIASTTAATAGEVSSARHTAQVRRTTGSPASRRQTTPSTTGKSGGASANLVPSAIAASFTSTVIGRRSSGRSPSLIPCARRTAAT